MLLIASFLAGVMTILTPCVLPVLPVIFGISNGKKSKIKLILTVFSLAFSIIIFSLLLKVSSLFIGVESYVWQVISGGLFLFFGLLTLFPEVWERFAIFLKLDFSKTLSTLSSDDNFYTPVLLGFALGPIFNSCSPTYLILLAGMANANFLESFLYLLVYVLGFSLVLLVTGLLGQAVLAKLNLLADPKGWFKKAIAVFFIILGLFIIFGIDKNIESWMVENGFGQFSVDTEIQLLNQVE